MPHLADLLLFIEIHEVDRKFHEERVDRFTRSDPETLAGVEFGVLEQAGTPLGAGIGNVGMSSEHRAAGQIAYLDWQASSVTQAPRFSTRDLAREAVEMRDGLHDIG